MKISIYGFATKTFVPMLQSLSNILDKGAEHARASKSDPAALVNARLAPDMYTLAQQVQLACNQAKDATARLTGHEPPHFDDNEQTLEELKARIAKTVAYVESVRAAALEGAEDRKIIIPIPENDMEFEMNGLQFLRDWALPHFYFHVVTAYDILRHKGVDIGKRDYLSHVGGYIRQRNSPA
ncbi:DUF1993 domain-containing protein [Candidatus Binatus sp.]|uniref:DUF1993 domain-containing protein n=1 Tax=Candidatus Binatus sp. TaxID=2811406 RepID=UPI003BAFF744